MEKCKCEYPRPVMKNSENGMHSYCEICAKSFDRNNPNIVWVDGGEASSWNFVKRVSISFHKWMIENNTQENADKYFHYSDEDMYKEFMSNGDI